MLDIVDRPGCITKAQMRSYFENAINNTAALKKTTPLGIAEINGQFSHYMNPDTDTMWLGFALGMRAAERIAAAMTPNVQIDGGAAVRASQSDAGLEPENLRRKT